MAVIKYKNMWVRRSINIGKAPIFNVTSKSKEADHPLQKGGGRLSRVPPDYVAVSCSVASGGRK